MSPELSDVDTAMHLKKLQKQVKEARDAKFCLLEDEARNGTTHMVRWSGQGACFPKQRSGSFPRSLCKLMVFGG